MEIKPYKTKDLGEAAALIVKDTPLIEIERDGRVCWFIFSCVDQCKLLSNQYFFGELLVNAREYSEAKVRLKNMIFR
jgi:hypothetical protein